MGGVTGSGSQLIGYRYSMSLHIGIGLGSIDELIEIRVGDKMAWPYPGGNQIYDGPNPAPGSPVLHNTGGVPINAPNLFGGDKGEGGIVGNFDLFLGAKDQVFRQDFKTIMGADVPDFRGVTTAWFDGQVCSLNPYPKAWKFRVRRVLNGWDGEPWYAEKARIVLRGGAIVAMNPAHILYEAMTNRDWGRGWNRSRLDEESFLLCADKLYEEKFGLCGRYNRQSKLSEFVQEVMNHIQAVIYTSRETGLITMDLIRNDYDPDNIPSFDYDSGLISVENPEVATREDMSNEVIVKFKDPIRNEVRSVRQQNLASIQTLEGGKNSATIEYMMLPTDGLASRCAARDLRIATTSGQRYSLVFNRTAWRLRPGSVFKISAPDKGIASLILRAGKVEQKDLTDGRISITAIPDIFGLPSSVPANVQTSYWTPPDGLAKPALYPTLREATYRDLVVGLSRADLSQVLPGECYTVGMATKPSSLSLAFGLATRTSSETEYVRRDTDTFAPTFVLDAAVSATGTLLSFSRSYDTTDLQLPCAGQIGSEIVRIDAVKLPDGTQPGTLTVGRGCVDTIPTVHTAGEPVILYDRFLGYDPRAYARGEVIRGKFITNTSSDALPLDKATEYSVTMNDRQTRPYGAANIKLNDVSIYLPFVPADNLVISWSGRDRVALQDMLLGFFEGEFASEPGTTYTVQLFIGSKVYHAWNGLTTTSITYSKSEQDADQLPSDGTQFTVSVATIRDGLIAFNIPLAIGRRP